ncbi:hypothetical protein EJ08DRAFT_665379 [Tothia fuscella]|uniref:Uncharacterized protein n=1 Tax=Tothia fuscella TaxID=1048955 RepID=A0A9P4NHC9_9PEZI|nr:hypothetical protein EJ08DRAFT_665379 [Tothia fuscella]
MAVALVPAAIWSGAITPISVGHNSTHMIEARTFNNQSVDLSSFWDSNISSRSGTADRSFLQSDKGLFTYGPVPIRGLLLGQASEASTDNPKNATHPKLDKTGFTFGGRSYGLGAAAGLVKLPTASSTIQAISYVEEGFESAVSCYYNKSTAYRIELKNTANPDFSLYRAGGSHPTGEKYFVDGDTIYAGRSPRDLFSWGAAYSSPEKAICLSMATPATPGKDNKFSFSGFNATQCEIRFTPSNFTVHANYTSNQISVTPLPKTVRPTFSNEVLADTVIAKIREWFHTISYVDGGFGGSQLGRSLRLNVDKLQA